MDEFIKAMPSISINLFVAYVVVSILAIWSERLASKRIASNTKKRKLSKADAYRLKALIRRRLVESQRLPDDAYKIMQIVQVGGLPKAWGPKPGSKTTRPSFFRRPR